MGSVRIDRLDHLVPGPAVRSGIQARGTCGLSWPGRVDVTGTGDGGHGRESWFAVMLDL
jgi:hypothetical protein